MVYSISDKIESKFDRVLNKKPPQISSIDNDIKKPEDGTDMDSKFSKLPQSEEEASSFPESEKWRIWKNVLVLGFAFMVHFTAFWGASNLQSSVNADGSLGTFTLAAIYGSLLVSNIFLPAIVIKLLKCKWTIAVSVFMYTGYILSQFYPKVYTMIPGGLLVGLGGAPLWCAKCTYLTIVAEAYASIVGVSSDIIVTRFFGVFFMFYQFSQVWGNLISSAVLSLGTEPEGRVAATNLTEAVNITSELLLGNTLDVNGTIISSQICGANFCPGETVMENPNLATPPVSKLNLIFGIYLACMIAAGLIIAFGLDPMSRYQKGKKEKNKNNSPSGCKLLAVTLKQLGNPTQLFILPITLFIGAEQAFIAADFNSAFVSCGWGISNIGFVMICFGVSNAISALIIGGIVKLTGRTPVIACALILHTGLLVALLLWTPTAENKLIYFILAGLWGVADSVWLVQINSLYGILFPGKEEAAYSNFRLWESTGSVVMYVCSPFLCINTKIYLLIAILAVGVCGYAIVEHDHSKNEENKFDFTDKENYKNVKSKEIPE